MTDRDFLVRTTTASDWQEIRALRLEGLADTPIAFTQTVESALTMDESYWRDRGARGEVPESTLVVAIENSSGRWIGTMSGVMDDDSGAPVAELVGVYVTPEYRGAAAGVADRLLDAVEAWAATVGSTLTLQVHETNSRAMGFYARRGFEPTGRTAPHQLEPYGLEIEMRKAVATAAAGDRLGG